MENVNENSSWLSHLMNMLSSENDAQNASAFNSNTKESDSRLICVPYFPKYFLDEKAKIIKRKITIMAATRQECMEKRSAIRSEIKNATKEIISNVKRREKNLLAELERITRPRVEKFENQLELCQAMLERSEDPQFSDIVSTEWFDRWFSQVCMGHVEQLRRSDIAFESASSDIILAIQKMGRIRRGGSQISLVPKVVIGSAGQGPGQFCRPWGVCTDGTGRILVADRSNHRIQIFSEYGEFLLEFGGLGLAPGQFHTPSGVAVDKKGRIIVADKDNHRIQIFTSSGAFLSTFGKRGSGLGEFDHPWDVAVNSNSEIAISDTKNHRIQLVDEYGVALTIFDFRNIPEIQKKLISPRGLAFRSDGMLLVTDFDNHKVLLFSARLENFVTFGEGGTNAEEFCRPQGIACDENDRFAVADCKNHRIQVFNSDGSLQRVLLSYGNAPGNLDSPQGVTFHPNGNLIVVDFGNSRVQIF